ncbi:MAG: sugar ABC transporter substrate-binding protein, partial [Chloroflexota bacterium]
MPDKLRIGAKIGTYDPFWIQVREAVHSVAQQAGVDLIPIEITDKPGNLTPEEQASLVDEFLAQSLGALICWNLPTAMLNRLLELGLPAIYLSESAIRHPRFVSPVGLGEAAAMVGSFLIEKLGGRGHVLCVGGLLEKDGEDGSSRIQGFQEYLRSYPEIAVTYIPCSWRYETAL